MAIATAPPNNDKEPRQSKDMMQPMKKKLGELLVERNIITMDQLQKALDVQKSTDELLGKVLVKMGVVDEKTITKIYGEQLGVEFEDLDSVEFDPEVVRLVPKHIALRYKILPFTRQKNSLSIAMVNPLNIFAVDDIKMLTGLEIISYITGEDDLMKAIERAYSAGSSAGSILHDLEGGGDVQTDEAMEKLKDEEEIGVGKLRAMGDETPMIKLSNAIIMQAVKDGVSDIHIEPMKTMVRIRFRIDGVLHEAMILPRQVHAGLTSRFKIMSKLDIAERRVPQDGRIPLRVEGREIDLRVATVPTIWGEKITMRVLEKSSIMIPLEKLGFMEDQFKSYVDLIEKPYGIIFAAGPTGCGKTTTLYASLNRLNRLEVNIISIEDPIEYQLPGVAQAQVNEKAEMTFAKALRSMLRQDPDIVMVGELRDRETAETAVQASLTGHLVLATIHANDSSSTITRLFHMGVEPFLVSSSVIGVLGQRLVRTICPDCKEEYRPPAEALERLGFDTSEDVVLYRGKGCDFCRGTGYRGRTGIYELLAVDDELRRLIVARSSAPAIKRKAIERGMITLKEDGLRKVAKGITSIEEAMRVVFDR